MSTFRNQFRPTIKGDVRGIENASRTAASAIHRKPVLAFTLPGQLTVDSKGNEVPENTPGAENVMVTITNHLRIVPRNKRPEHSNRVQAGRDRITASQRIIEKVSIASQGEGKNAKVSRSDLPDTELLVELYEELDYALDEKLLALVSTDSNGDTEWDYVNADGEPVNLTADLLKADVNLAESLQTALAAWEKPTKPSSEDATQMKKESGTKDLTEKTPPASLSSSPMLSSVPNQTPMEASDTPATT